MRDSFFSLPGIESDKESTVLLLLAQSVFLGIFFGAFDISAHSLFLAIFDEKMMARGYVLSGIAGIILTSLYTRFHTRLEFRNFTVTNILFVTLFTLILWIALILNPAEWVIFIVFIMLGPLNILAILGFRKTTGRLFTSRQGDRLLELADTGLISGIIIICYAIPVLISFRFGLHNIILISASSVFVAAIIQMIIGNRFRYSGSDGDMRPDISKVRKPVFTAFYEDRYTGIIALFIALSVITAFFIQYSFIAVTRVQYPSGEDLAGFLGIFTGSVMSLTLLVKLFVFKYLIRNYGLRTCLAISPVILAAIVLIAISFGIIMGYTPESVAGFLIFFIILALSRLLSVSLKTSVEFPSLGVIYQTIDEKIRYKFQSGFNGTINEIAAVISGLLLTGLGILGFIRLIHFSVIIFFLILIWIFVAFRLYMEYKKALRKNLETVGHMKSGTDFLDERYIYKSRFSANRNFRKDYFSLISGDYSALEKNTNKWYYENIIIQSDRKKDFTLIPVLKKITNNSTINDRVRQQASDEVKTLEKLLSDLNIADDRITSSRKTLAGTRQPQTTEILRLLRDNSIEAKRLAIFMIGKFKFYEMLSDVCECLNIPGLETDASAVLQTFGSGAGDDLERFYLISSGNSNTSKIILRLLGSTNSKESFGFLFSRLWSNSRQLKEVAVNCLIEGKFKASGEDKERLLILISETIGIMTWNLSAKVCLENNNDIFLLELMNKEIERWNNFLFNILSITYDSDYIDKIRINLKRSSVESVTLALELIDLVIDDAIKPKLISLLNAGKDTEKLKNLHNYFPGDVQKYNKLLEYILNRDYNLISVWTKASTLRSISAIEDIEMAESVIALLFSPEILLQEESVNLMSRTNPKLYKSVSHRLPDSTRKRLDRIINGEISEMELLFEKVSFLSNYFIEIPEEELLPLAGVMKYTKEPGKGLSPFDNDCIIWSVSDKKHSERVSLYYYGEMKAQEADFIGKDHSSYYSIPLSNIEEYINQHPEKSSVILRYIENIDE
jgi:ATP:ADP antiporter, AAA family